MKDDWYQAGFADLFGFECTEVVPLDEEIASLIEDSYMLEYDVPGTPQLVGLVFSNGKVYFDPTKSFPIVYEDEE